MNSNNIVFLLLSALAVAKCTKIRTAPFFMPLDNDPPDAVEVMKATGLKHFVFAFVLAPNAGGCVPTWDGLSNQTVSSDTEVVAKIKAIRAAGGDVSVSFGGYNGIELARACSDPQQLANAYQAVVDKYSLTNLDFDIEGVSLGDVDSENRRFKAIKILKDTAKARGKELYVSLTLPATTVGLSDLGRSEIKRGIDDGALIDVYLVMAFDYGGPAADMANNVIKVMESTHQQLKQLKPELNDDQIYTQTGIIMMNGHTDQPSELFTFDTFQKIIDYANSKRLGRMSYWAVNRDRDCGSKVVGWVSGVCSSIKQQSWDFSKILAKFN